VAKLGQDLEVNDFTEKRRTKRPH